MRAIPYVSWYRSGMAIPITVAIVLLGALVGLLAWLLARSERRYEHLQAEFMRVTTEYSSSSLKIAGEMMRNQPKYADKMLDSLARGIKDVTEGVTSSMKAIYGPVQTAEQAAASEMGDLPTPWYASEGSMDFTDPTDGLLGGIADPSADQAPGNLILNDDDNPFGIPGLKVGD